MSLRLYAYSARRLPLVRFAHFSQAASIPEGQNELKRNQLRELAALNGTLRDDENQACQNCGKIGHRKYDCPERQNFTASIICRVCGNAGHMARDCPDRQRGASWRNDANGGRSGRPGGPGGGDAVDREMQVCYLIARSSELPSLFFSLKPHCAHSALATHARARWRSWASSSSD